MGQGPLNGVRLVEFSGLGPTPFAAMTLADMGAEIVRIDRPNAKPLLPQKVDILNRGRRKVELNLKTAKDRDLALDLIAKADGVIEGMRPGVMERLGLGPEQAFRASPKLVYGRMTGWGQEGPLAHAAGHDINYISLSGALHAIGPAEAPIPPINLLGDFGGGAMYLAFGMVCALLEARTSGKGQVVDGAIVDGVAHLSAMVYSLRQAGLWEDARGCNILDGGAPWYGIYACADGRFLSVGAIEPQFYAEFMNLIGLGQADLPGQHDRAGWPVLKARIAGAIAAKPLAQWQTVLEGTDACAAPILTLDEAFEHPHNLARKVFEDVDGIKQPAAAPRLSRTPGKAGRALDAVAVPASEILQDWAQ